tara:strand:+ start:1505 stop:1807 length:303 start_codon:yes stop_codon:yes gene_type:complete
MEMIPYGSVWGSLHTAKNRMDRGETEAILAKLKDIEYRRIVDRRRDSYVEGERREEEGSGALYPTPDEALVELQFRLRVALDACLGLSYLHSLTPPIVHR